MEISFLFVTIYTVFNCFIEPSQSIKTFSLNDAIAAESKQRYKATNRPKPDLSTTTPKEIKLPTLSIKPLRQLNQSAKTFIKDTQPERFSLLKIREPPKRKSKIIENITPQDLKSTLSNRKTFQIKSPLKPKKLKYSRLSRYKRKNQPNSEQNDVNQEYIPLVKNIRLLFNNLLNTDSSNSNEINDYNKGSSEARNQDNACTCSHGKINRTGTKKEQEAITSASVITAKISPTASTELTAHTTNTAANSDISTLRKNKILPILLARNSTGSRRNYNGIGKRRGTTFHRSIQRNITRPHGDSKHYTNKRKHDSREKNDKQTPDSHPRDDAGSNGLDGKVRRVTNSTGFDGDDKIKTRENATASFRGDIDESKRQNKLKAERNDAANPVFIRQLNRRWNLSENKINDNSKSVQSEENSEKSNIDVTNNNTTNKRIPDRNGTFPAQVQGIRPRNEARTLDNLPFKTEPIDNNKSRNTPGVVIIIDGYSIARDKNGEDTVAKKSAINNSVLF